MCVSLISVPDPPLNRVGGWNFRWINGFCFDSLCAEHGFTLIPKMSYAYMGKLKAP